MNKLNRPDFLLNNKTFQTIYGRNLLNELNIIIPNETLIVTMEDLWEDFSSFLLFNKEHFFSFWHVSGCSLIAFTL